MSHFTVVVLVRQDAVPEPGHPDFAKSLMSKIADMLAPFDEDIRVDPYPRACLCGDYALSRKVRELTVRETGLNVDDLRSTWWAKTDDEREQSSWEAHIEPYTSVYDRHEKDMSRDKAPESDCEDCHGTGFYESTYNPRSKWDWYSVGGRWDGDFKEHSIPTLINNVAFARDLHSAAYAPFAILSPREAHQKQNHDNWSERGQMGWFGMTSNENDNWPAIASELFDKYSGCFAVLIDCHI